MTSKSAHKSLPASRQGFTLIELLIVIAVIAGLTVMGLITYPGAQKSARDARRKADINQYQAALEVYANKSSGAYPNPTPTNTVMNISTICGSSFLNLTSCANDPITSTYYRYASNGTDYVVFGTLERQTTNGTNDYWVVCSNGNKGKTTTAPTNSTCPGTLTP